jgi:hypothetical protein
MARLPRLIGLVLVFTTTILHADLRDQIVPFQMDKCLAPIYSHCTLLAFAWLVHWGYGHEPTPDRALAITDMPPSRGALQEKISSCFANIQGSEDYDVAGENG